MFNHEAQGDFNVSRKVALGVVVSIKVFNADMEAVATFYGDMQEEAYRIFLNGFVVHGGNSMFDLDTGEFVVGTLDQLVHPAPPVIQHPIARSDWQRYDLGKSYFLSHHIPSHSVHVYWYDTFLDAGAWGHLDKLADSLMKVSLSAAAVDRAFVRDRVLEVKDRFDTPAKVLKLGAFGGESTEAQEANNAANTRAKRDAVSHPLGSDRYAD